MTDREREEVLFLEMYNASEFEHPSVTVDILVFTVTEGRLEILLIRRATPPYAGKWALPGGFLRMDESAEQAAARRVREEAGVEGVHLEQLYTFSAVDRDPRTRVISIAYLVTVPRGKLKFSAGEETEAAALYTVQCEGPSLTLTAADGTVLTMEDLAFDHAAIIRTAVERMRGKLDYTDLAFGFLEDLERFTLSELRSIHEAILGRKLDIGNFRRTIKREYESTGRIVENEKEHGVIGRPAMLYRYLRAGGSTEFPEAGQPTTGPGREPGSGFDR